MRLLILFFLVYLPCNAQRSTSIATGDMNSYKFSIDTTEFKKNISKELAAVGYNVVFERIQIKKQNTLGSKKEFFYLLLTSKDKTVKAARWLTNNDKNFFIIDETEQEDLFEQTWLTCIGNRDCSPNVFEDRGMREWGCSGIVGCTPQKGESRCITLQSLF